VHFLRHGSSQKVHESDNFRNPADIFRAHFEIQYETEPLRAP